jgi:class 3 adenylate cyclase
VIGTDIVRFDIYGPDVLIANKMESGGESGKICVSQQTKDLLETLETSNYTFENKANISIKALGIEIPSFFLTSNLLKEEELKEDDLLS